MKSLKVHVQFPDDCTVTPYYEHSGPISKLSIGYSAEIIKEILLEEETFPEVISFHISQFADSEITISILEYWTKYDQWANHRQDDTSMDLEIPETIHDKSLRINRER